MAQATLVQGSTDFSPYVALDGVGQSYTERLATSIVTLDGSLRKASVRKRVLSVKLHDMWHDDLIALMGAVTAQPASWTYLDADAGQRTATFYLTSPTVRQKLARGGKTLCSGISFTLEEQ